jgi:hypothetical protein
VQSLTAGNLQLEGVPADLPALPLGHVLLLLLLSARVPLVPQLQAGQVLTALAAKVLPIHLLLLLLLLQQ